MRNPDAFQKLLTYYVQFYASVCNPEIVVPNPGKLLKPLIVDWIAHDTVVLHSVKPLDPHPSPLPEAPLAVCVVVTMAPLPPKKKKRTAAADAAATPPKKLKARRVSFGLPLDALSAS
jgi:hypothetical protein